MSLLKELNTILTEAASRVLTIDGYRVDIYDYKAQHGYYEGKQLAAASMDGPADYSEDESKHLKISELSFDVEKSEDSWIVGYNLGGKDYHQNEAGLMRDLSTMTPEIRDHQDEIVHDQRTIMLLKNIVVKYAQQFDCLGYLYEKAEQKPIEDYDDHFDDRSDEVGDHPDY